VHATFAIRYSAVGALLLRALPNHRSIMHHHGAQNRFSGLTQPAQTTTPPNGGVALPLTSQSGCNRSPECYKL
jgi:hypothetical protein